MDDTPPLPAVVRAGLAQLPEPLRAPVEQALSGLAPFMALDSAEVSAAVAAAINAQALADRTERVADELDGAFAETLALEERRWTTAIELVGAQADTTEDVDRLAAVLGVDHPGAAAETFDEFMLDEGTTLRLGPAPAERDGRHRLSIVARPASPGTHPDLGDRLPDLVAPGLLAASAAGQWIDGPSGPAILLGDGSQVRLTSGELEHATADPDDLEDPLSLRVDRWATGRPPLLQPHAAAAFAAAMAARSAGIAIEPEAIPGLLTLGAPLAASDVPTSRLAEAYALLRELVRIEDVHAGAEVLLRLAFACSRVRLYLVPAEPQPPCMVIHVGHVRWCTLSDRPLFWLPAFSDHPDSIGGPDRPWTTEIPAAAAVWEPSSPALRLDPDWSAALVVVPGDSQLMCVDPAGDWWHLDVDYEAVILARRNHREPWLDALEILEDDVPRTIAAARQRADDAQEQREMDNDTANGANSSGTADVAVTPFSRDWVRSLAVRYAYADDSAVREAGEAAARRGHYTRDEFMTVVTWKSKRTVPLAQRNSQDSVVQATAQAFATDDEIARLLFLLSLDGVGAPVASALLHFAYPDRYPILDYRALATLGVLTRRSTYGPDFWVDYVDKCQDIARDAGVTIRDLDKALWQASKDADARGRPS